MEARWFRRVGPGILAIGAVLLVASTTTGSRGPDWRPVACDGSAHVESAPSGAWYRLDPQIVDGVRRGQRLSIGVAGDATIRAFDLDSESFAAGPFAGSVLTGTDDGEASRVSLIDVAAACAWSIDRSAEVVRRATITPDGQSLIEFRVDRRSRADLGVWRRPLAGPGPETRILGPIEADERFGRTWLTELSWSDDGTLLAVTSCGEVACRVRWLDLESGASGTVADPAVGDMIGIAGDLLVAHGSCRGLPCPIRTASLAGGPPTTLVAEAGQAVLSRDAKGLRSVVVELDPFGGVLGSVGIDGGDPRRWAADPSGRRLVAGPTWADGGAELPIGWVAVGPEGRFPLGGPVDAVLRRVPDGHSVPFGEVRR